MRYSFTVRGASKAEALSAVSNELQKVVWGQPVHAVDQAQAQAAAEAFINLLVEDSEREIAVNVSGSIWQEIGVRQAGVSVTASVVDKA